MIRMTHHALLALLGAALLFACGGAPQPAPETPETPEVSETPETPEVSETPALADDGAKPGEHGCGSCAVRICAAGSAINDLRVQIKLETHLKDVRYEKAVLRLKLADGRSEAALLEPAKLAAGVGSVQTVSAAKFTGLKTRDDVKGAAGELELRWRSPEGPGGGVFTLPVAVGSCP